VPGCKQRKWKRRNAAPGGAAGGYTCEQLRELDFTASSDDNSDCGEEEGDDEVDEGDEEEEAYEDEVELQSGVGAPALPDDHELLAYNRPDSTGTWSSGTYGSAEDMTLKDSDDVDHICR
jgi:hypothetical protein